MMVSLSRGLIDLKLITSALIPYSFNLAAASRENLTFLEYATIVTWLPSTSTLAFPNGIKKSSSFACYDISNVSPYKYSFSRIITGSFDLKAILVNPI